MPKEIKHTVNREEMIGYVHECVIAFSSGRHVDKSLSCEVHFDDKTFKYKVTNSKEIVYHGDSLDEAVNCYNDI